MEKLSSADESSLFGLLNTENRNQYLSSSNIGNFVFKLSNRNLIFDRLSRDGQRVLLRTMDENKRVEFISHIESPVIFKTLSMNKVTMLFREVQFRVHKDRPNSLTYKDNSICFKLPNFQSHISIHEIPHKYFIKESSLFKDMGYRITKDNDNIIESIDNLYNYIGILDKFFFDMFCQLKTQMLLLYSEDNK